MPAEPVSESDSDSDLRLAVAVHRRLLAEGGTVGSAESITGGALGAALSGPAGASATYVGGVVCYATRLKTSLLEVPEALVREHGVVSAACAEAMAVGARRLLGADWAVATTGVAGPTEQEGRPVGTVFVGLAGPGGLLDHQELALAGDRAEVRAGTVTAALVTLVRRLDPGAV